jgi:hypothetical protein
LCTATQSIIYFANQHSIVTQGDEKRWKEKRTTSIGMQNARHASAEAANISQSATLAKVAQTGHANMEDMKNVLQSTIARECKDYERRTSISI